MDEEQSNELLKILAHTFDILGEDAFLVYIDIQKVLYYLQKRLDEGNEIADLLPYYWYFDGPVSDTVQQTVYYAEERGMLTKEPTPNGGVKYRLSTDSGIEVTPRTEDSEAALNSLEEVLDHDYEVHANYHEKIEDVYEEAPFEFQRYCKLELVPAVKEFDENQPWHYSTEEIANRVSMAESYLPLDSAFEDFNALYSHYLTLAKLYLEQVDENTKTGSSAFYSLTDDMWELFCHQLRMVEHDPYYDAKMSDWELDYEQKKRSFGTELRQFESFLNEEYGEFDVNTDDPGRLPEDSSWGKVASSLLDY